MALPQDTRVQKIKGYLIKKNIWTKCRIVHKIGTQKVLLTRIQEKKMRRKQNDLGISLHYLWNESY